MQPLAEKHGLDYRTFALEDNAKLDAAFQEVELVLHYAGHFSLTSNQIVKACPRNKNIPVTQDDIFDRNDLFTDCIGDRAT